MPYLIIFIVIIVIILMYIWLLGWLLFVIASVALGPLLLLALAASFVLAAIMPIILLTLSRWRENRDRRLRPPDQVRAGVVLGKAPRGEAAGWGWDPAWPTYFPYQAKGDFGFVSNWMWHRSLSFFALPIKWALVLWDISTGIVRLGWWLPVIIGMIVTVGIPSWIFAVFVTVFTFVFIAVLWVVMTVATLITRVFAAVYGTVERGRRRRAAKQLNCTNENCYRTSYVPGYECPTCGEVHRSLQPGPLGVFHRVCACGTTLPSTASRAATQKLTVVCPYCSARLDATAGARPTVLVPVIGPVASGKTTLFASAVRGMAALAAERHGRLQPTNDAARRFAELSEAGGVLPKTADASRPQVMTFDVVLEDGEYELQLVDAAGERFVTQESTGALTYIDSSGAWVFVLDPLMLPGVRSRLDENAIGLGATEVGTGDLAGAYQSVIERFKAMNGDLKGKALAIVVTKADLLVQVPEWSDLGSGESVKDMLGEAGAHNLVRSAELDFKERLKFFATEAQTREGLDSRRDPVRVIDWAIAHRRMRLRFLPDKNDASAQNDTPATTPGE